MVLVPSVDMSSLIITPNHQNLDYIDDRHSTIKSFALYTGTIIINLLSNFISFL
jgi:hypothetical protein